MVYTIKRYHGSYNISRRTQPVRYIVVHYTGSGTSAPGSARKNCQYFAGGNRNSSAHYFIDDGYIYEYADPDRYYTWHCGDGKGRYGIANANSVGIEVCRNGNQPYTAAELDRLHWMVRQLMERYDVPESRVMRHYDASRKACPYWYTPYGSGGTAGWNNLRNTITDPYGSEPEEEDLTPEQAQMLTDIRNEVKRTDDCTGRERGMLDHDKLNWLGANQSDMRERIDAMDKKLDSIIEALSK